MKKKIAIVDVPAASVRTLLDQLPAEVVLTGNSLPCMANSLRLIFDVSASEIGGGRHGYEQFKAQLPKHGASGLVRAPLASLVIADETLAYLEKEARGELEGHNEWLIENDDQPDPGADEVGVPPTTLLKLIALARSKPVTNDAMVEALRASLDYVDEAGGTALALAMSGKDHPRLDDLLMGLQAKSKNVSATARPVLAAAIQAEALWAGAEICDVCDKPILQGQPRATVNGPDIDKDYDGPTDVHFQCVSVRKDKVKIAEAKEACWSELCEVDDRNSPEEYPDMCLITQNELWAFMDAAVEAATFLPNDIEEGN